MQAATRQRGQPTFQVVDPSVSRVKFAREVERLRDRAEDYRKQGCVLLDATFPRIELMIGVPQLRPWPILFGVCMDFTNYDAIPPSVRLVNPWTRELLRNNEVGFPLPRITKNESVAEGDSAATPPTYSKALIVQGGFPPSELPFLCARGIREYHAHPGHTGDSWWLHRRRGEGTLDALVDLFVSNGPQAVSAFSFQIGGRMQKAGANAFIQQFGITAMAYSFRAPDGAEVGEA